MNILRKLLPSSLEAIFYLFLSFMILLLGNLWVLNTYFDQGKIFLSSTSSEFFHNGLDSLSKLGFTADAITFVFWGGIGLLVFTLMQAAYGAYQGVYDDITVSTRFLHPRRVTQHKFWYGILINFLYNVVSFSLLAISVYFLIFYFFPFSMVLARIYLVHITDYVNIMYFLSGFFMLFLAFNFCIIFLKMIFNRPVFTQLLIK